MLPAEKKAVVVLVNGGSGLGFGETTQLRNGITARAMGIDYDGDGLRWSRKVLFIAMVLLPMVFGVSMIWAWFRRTKVRAKLNSGCQSWVARRSPPHFCSSPILVCCSSQPR